MKNALPIFLIVVVIGLFYQYINPQFKHIEELQAERDGYDEVLKKADELRTIRSELAEKVNRFSEQDLEKLGMMLPKEMDLVRLVLEIDNIAIQNGIIMRDINAEFKDEMESEANEDGSPKLFQTLALTFKFKTNYGNLTNFLPDIESSLRIMDIVSVRLTSDKEQPSVQDYEITINTYWIK